MIKTITQDFETETPEDADMEINTWTELNWSIRHIEMKYIPLEKGLGFGGSIQTTGWTVRTFILEWPFQNAPVCP